MGVAFVATAEEVCGPKRPRTLRPSVKEVRNSQRGSIANRSLAQAPEAPTGPSSHSTAEPVP